MSIAQDLYKEAFDNNPYRDPRSDAYKQGVLYALEYRADDTSKKPGEVQPYNMGTVEADAWFSGLQEGYNRWRHHHREEGCKAFKCGIKFSDRPYDQDSVEGAVWCARLGVCARRFR